MINGVSYLTTDIVVKEEISENDQAELEEPDLNLDLDYCGSNNEIKTETDQEFSSDGQRRSRRIQKRNSARGSKLSTCLEEEEEGEEEKESEKLKWKCGRRKGKNAKLTEEEKLIKREKARMYRQTRLQKINDGSVPRPKQRSRKEEKQSNTESKGSYKTKQLTEEEKRERRMKEKFKKLVKEAEMTEEQLAQEKMRRFLQSQAWKASKSKEELKEMNRKRNETVKRKLREDEDFRRHKLETSRKWKENLTEEKRERYMGSVKKAVKKYLSNLKFKNPEKYKQNYEKFKVRLRNKTANETPEQRQKRLQRYKINAAKKKLKRQLEQDGMDPELIQKKINDLVEELKQQPMPPLSSEYKPRPRKASKVTNDKTDVNETVDDIQENIVEDENNEEHFTCVDASTVVDEDANISYSYHFVPCIALNSLEVEGGEDIGDLGASIIITSAVVLDDEGLSSSTAAGTLAYSHENKLFVCSSEPTQQYVQDDHHHIGIDDTFSLPQDSSSQVVVVNDSLCETIPSSPPEPLIISEPEETTKPVFPVSLNPPLPIVSSPSFKCTYCPEFFSTEEGLRTHLNTLHPITCWKCPKCFQVMLSPEEFSDHFKSHLVTVNSLEEKPSISELKKNILKRAKFICMRCPYPPPSSIASTLLPNNMFETLELLTAHVKKKHPKSFWPCSNCRLLKYSKDRLEFHQKRCFADVDSKVYKKSARFQKKKGKRKSY